MSEETTEKSGKTWLYVVGLVLALPILYVLSVGPAVVLVGRNVVSNSTAKTLYLPLERFAHATNTEDVFGGYIEVWMNATGTYWYFPK